MSTTSSRPEPGNEIYNITPAHIRALSLQNIVFHLAQDGISQSQFHRWQTFIMRLINSSAWPGSSYRIQQGSSSFVSALRIHSNPPEEQCTRHSGGCPCEKVKVFRRILRFLALNGFTYQVDVGGAYTPLTGAGRVVFKPRTLWWVPLEVQTDESEDEGFQTESCDSCCGSDCSA